MAASFALQQIGLARDKSRFPPPGQLVSVGDHRLHLRCVGQGAPTVLILSGGGTPAVTSFDVQDRISIFTRACTYDRAGLGWSDPAPRRQGLSESTGDLQALLKNAREHGPYILVPESFGGLIALNFIKRSPGQVAGAVFVDASEPRLWFGTMPQEANGFRLHNFWWRPAVAFGVVRALFPYLAPDWVRALPDERRAQFRSVYARPTQGYGEAVDAFDITRPQDRPVASPGALGNRPLIVLEHGRASPMLAPPWEPGWPAAQQRLTRLSTNGQRIVLPRTGHAMAGENPGAVAEAVKRVVVMARGAANDATSAKTASPAAKKRDRRFRGDAAQLVSLSTKSVSDERQRR